MDKKVRKVIFSKIVRACDICGVYKDPTDKDSWEIIMRFCDKEGKNSIDICSKCQYNVLLKAKLAKEKNEDIISK